MASTLAAASSSAASADLLFFLDLPLDLGLLLSRLVGASSTEDLLFESESNMSSIRFLLSLKSSPLPLRRASLEFDREDIAAIISSTFCAAYFSAALETSELLDLQLDFFKLFPLASFLAKKAFQASE